VNFLYIYKNTDSKGRREESEFSQLLSSISHQFAKVFHVRGMFQLQEFRLA